MPRRHQRTRSVRRHVSKKPSGSGSTIHYRRARVHTARCAECGRILFGTKTEKPTDLRRISMSKKRPQRIFGGQLCHICLQQSLKRAARGVAS